MDDYWSNTSCWSPNGSPSALDNATITPVSGQNTIARLDSGSVSVSGLTIFSSTVSNTVTFQQTNGSLSTSVGESVSSGIYDQSGGTHTAAGLYIGSNAIGGTYNLSGTANLTANTVGIGNGFLGTFNQSGGTHTVTGGLYLGRTSSYNYGTGIYNLSGGSLSTSFEIVGQGGASTFTQTGGTHSVANHLQIFQGSAYNLDGGALTVYNVAGGGGALNVDGGALSVVGTVGSYAGNQPEIDVDTFRVGYRAGMTGSHTLSGTTDLKAKYEFIGDSGAGSFTQNGGTNTVVYELSVGGRTGGATTGVGTYNLNSGTLSAASESIGASGIGTFTQNGGTNTLNNLLLGRETTGNGSYNLNSGSLLITTPSVYNPFLSGPSAKEIVGENGTGSFSQTGGTNQSQVLYLGYAGTGHGTYNLIGGNLSGTQYIGESGTGIFNQTGGTNSAGYLRIANNLGSTGSYTLSGNGVLSATYEYIGTRGTGTFNQSGGTHTVQNTLSVGSAMSGSSAAYNLSGGALTVNGGIANRGSFNIGTGTTVTVGGSGFVNHGELNGTGTIAGNVTSDGTLAPGNSPGALTIAGDYTQLTQGLFSVEIGGLLSGTEYDVLNVTGIASLDGILNVSLFDLGGGVFAPQAGDSFDILTAEVLQGSFSTLDFAVLLDPSLQWTVSYLTDAIGTTDIVRLNVVSAVPVPAAAWLFVSGFLGLAVAARRGDRSVPARSA